MKRIVVVLLAVVLLASVALAQTNKIPEDWQWKLRALFAELNLQQQRFNEARDAAQAFLRELDAKGFTVKDGVIVEKPKPASEPKK